VFPELPDIIWEDISQRINVELYGKVFPYRPCSQLALTIYENFCAAVACCVLVGFFRVGCQVLHFSK
jgi:hypothetical protein